MGSPIDRTAKTALDSNLVNGVTSDAPKVKANNDVLYNYADTLNSALDTHAAAAILPHADQSVTGPKIKDYTLTETKYATGSVSSRAIANGAVGANQLATGLAAPADVNAQFAKRGLDVTSAPYNAKGDGVTDDTAAIQAAVNALLQGQLLYFPPGTYKITSPITITKNYFSIEGAGMGTIIQNAGTGSALVFTGCQFFSIRNLSVRGNGGAYGVGATGTNGIEFNNSQHWSLTNMDIQMHGGHGVYCHGGVWNTTIDKSVIWNNLMDGVNSVSPSGASTDQNGNNFSITNSVIFLNTRHGVNWKASGLNISGTDIETNKGAGLLVDCTGSTLSAFGVNVTGSYFESNYLGQIKLVGITSFVVNGVSISGNSFTSSITGAGNATSLIVGTGAANTLQLVEIGTNSYTMSGGKVVTWVDLGNAPASSCNIQTLNNISMFVNLGWAKVIYGVRTRTINGLFHQKGYAFSGIEKSDNIFAMATKSGLWEIPIEEGQIFKSASILIESDATTDYTISIYIQGSDRTTNAAIATIAGTVITATGGGNKLATWDLASTFGTYRHIKNCDLFLRIDISNPTTGANMFLHDAILGFI